MQLQAASLFVNTLFCIYIISVDGRVAETSQLKGSKLEGEWQVGISAGRRDESSEKTFFLVEDSYGIDRMYSTEFQKLFNEDTIDPSRRMQSWRNDGA